MRSARSAGSTDVLSAQTGEVGIAPHMLVALAKRVGLAGLRPGAHSAITLEGATTTSLLLVDQTSTLTRT
jgi:hypothetical protein